MGRWTNFLRGMGSVLDIYPERGPFVPLKVPKPRIHRWSEMHAERNCAVRERTGDGKNVGRCWFHTEEKNDRLTCPRHGDVTEVQSHYRATGELSEDPRDG